MVRYNINSPFFLNGVSIYTEYLLIIYIIKSSAYKSPIWGFIRDISKYCDYIMDDNNQYKI